MKQFLLFFATVVWLGACSTDTTCRKEKTIVLKAEFYSDSINTETGDTVVFRVSFNALTVRGVGNDSVLYKAQDGISTITLPLRADTSRTDYQIELAGVNDVLTIYHDNQESFISFECGCFVYHTITNVQTTGNKLVGGEIVNQTVTTEDETHIHLRFK